MTFDATIPSDLAATHRAMWALGDYALMAEEVMAPLGPVLVAATGIGPGVRVLDVAAGSGNISLPAAATGADVVSTDLTPSCCGGPKRAPWRITARRSRRTRTSATTGSWPPISTPNSSNSPSNTWPTAACCGSTCWSRARSGESAPTDEGDYNSRSASRWTSGSPPAAVNAFSARTSPWRSGGGIFSTMEEISARR